MMDRYIDPGKENACRLENGEYRTNRVEEYAQQIGYHVTYHDTVRINISIFLEQRIQLFQRFKAPRNSQFVPIFPGLGLVILQHLSKT